MQSDGFDGRSVSIFFYAGDFVDVLRRQASGEQQIYATHDEVARLILDLQSMGVRLTIYSYITPRTSDHSPLDGVRIVSLGGSPQAHGVLARAVLNDTSETIIAHFANPELLKATLRSGKRVFAGLANSYNERNLRALIRRARIVRMLNDHRIDAVTNHCLPATRQLQRLGVSRAKLVAWDVPHRFTPADHAAKSLVVRDTYRLAYAGSIAELKGVGDLLRSLALLKNEGFSAQATLAGLGDIEQMRQLAGSLGVGDLVEFRGIVGNEDVFLMFQQADVVVVPSRANYPEGFPLTIFEAIASRSPIVCSDHPMFRPVMRDGHNAAVFRSGNVKGFAAAIRRVLTDETLYQDLSGSAVRTWATLKGPADWRTLMKEWIVNGKESEWVARYSLNSPDGPHDTHPLSMRGSFSINSKYLD